MLKPSFITGDSGPLVAHLPTNTVWLDIETRKVPAPAGWPQKLRWQTFMVGLAWRQDAALLLQLYHSDDEAALLQHVGHELTLHGQAQVRYAATREFDAMVLCGQFTNARRAHSITPGAWPHLQRAAYPWRNARKTLWPHHLQEALDCASKDVPKLWAAGQRRVVQLHCIRDVARLVREDNDLPIPMLDRILTRNDFLPAEEPIHA